MIPATHSRMCKANKSSIKGIVMSRTFSNTPVPAYVCMSVFHTSAITFGDHLYPTFTSMLGNKVSASHSYMRFKRNLDETSTI